MDGAVATTDLEDVKWAPSGNVLCCIDTLLEYKVRDNGGGKVERRVRRTHLHLHVHMHMHVQPSCM